MNHDTSLKDLASDPEFYIALVKDGLPKEVRALLDLDSIEIADLKVTQLNAEFTREQQRKNVKQSERADVVYSF